MNVTVTLLLLSLLSATLIGFATESNINESGLLSIDKIFKILVIGLAFIVLLFRKKRFYLPKDIWVYILIGIFFILCLLINYLFYSEGDDFNAFRAKKEIVRLAVILIIFLLCGGLLSENSDYKIFVYIFGMFGLVVSILSLYQTFTGQSERTSAYIGGYLRAGVDITGLSLGGALNIIFSVCMIGYLIKDKFIHKLLFFLSLVIIQGARFATFSTGTLLSSIITIVISIFLLRVYHIKALRDFLKITIFMIFLFSIFMWKTGLTKTIFYRAFFSDEHVKQASFYSRLDQHKGYLKLVRERPENLVFGVGTARLPALLGKDLDLHNSYLRPLAVGGVVAFVCYLFLCWFCLRDFLFSIKTQHTDEVHLIVSIFFLAAYVGWAFHAATFPADTSCVQWFFFIFAFMLRHTISRNINHTMSLVSPRIKC